MLALRRRLGETIVIGENIRITVVSIDGASVRLAIDAPGILVFREELLRSLQQENERASNAEGTLTQGGGISSGRVKFPQGLFGFGDHREYTLYDIDQSFRAISSVMDPALCFFLVDPLAVSASFPLALACDAYPFAREPVAVAAIVTRPADGSMPTVNLRAPLVIGVGSGCGAQIILNDERLSLRHPLFDLTSENRGSR